MKGKYSAKAANRTAALDNEIIIELREELAAQKKTNESLRQQIEAERAKRNSLVLAESTRNTHRIVQEHKDALAAEKLRHAELLSEVADSVVNVIRLYTKAVKDFSNDDRCIPRAILEPDDSGDPSLLAVFRMLAPDRAARLFDDCFSLPTWGREEKRRSAKKMSRDIKLNAQRDSRKELVEKFKSQVN